MVVDFDDFCQDNHRLDLLHQLRDAHPAFRVTLFAIPARGSDDFWDAVPDWCEVAMHGWLHPHSREAEDWSYEAASEMMWRKPPRFVEGFKAPGWQISDATYRALADNGWWVADHWETAGRRPEELRAFTISPETARHDNPDHWHGHIQNVCQNGLEETFPQLLERVREATSFEWVSEVVA